MILVPRPFSITQIYDEPYCIPNFHSASIMPILLQWEWCHLPLLQTSSDVASPCFDLTGSVPAVLHMQVLWQRQLRKGPGCSRQRSRGDCRQQGDQVWLRYLVRGDRLFCRGQSGGTAFEGQGGTAHGVTVLPPLTKST